MMVDGVPQLTVLHGIFLIYVLMLVFGRAILWPDKARIIDLFRRTTPESADVRLVHKVRFWLAMILLLGVCGILTAPSQAWLTVELFLTLGGFLAVIVQWRLFHDRLKSASFDW